MLLPVISTRIPRKRFVNFVPLPAKHYWMKPGHNRIWLSNGRYARFTSGGQGSYTINGEYGEYDNKAGNPKEEEVWTLEKNLCGCWQITEFEFH